MIEPPVNPTRNGQTTTLLDTPNVNPTLNGQTTTPVNNPNTEKEKAEKMAAAGAGIRRLERDMTQLTLNVELDGGEAFGAMQLISTVQELCGAILACRVISPRKFEITMKDNEGKERLTEGFKVGDTRVHASDVLNEERVVSFLNLPYYIRDMDIVAKLTSWGVTAVSPIKRRMWPGTLVTDGTRFLKVRFTKQVQSLPYSTKFTTAQGSEYFRVLHDKQLKICRICMQPGHIQRECPEFYCRKCGIQGHYARECIKKRPPLPPRCTDCNQTQDNCVCSPDAPESVVTVEEEMGEEQVMRLAEEEDNMDDVQSLATSESLLSEPMQSSGKDREDEDADESDDGLPDAQLFRGYEADETEVSEAQVGLTVPETEESAAADEEAMAGPEEITPAARAAAAYAAKKAGETAAAAAAEPAAAAAAEPEAAAAAVPGAVATAMSAAKRAEEEDMETDSEGATEAEVFQLRRGESQASLKLRRLAESQRVQLTKSRRQAKKRKTQEKAAEESGAVQRKEKGPSQDSSGPLSREEGNPPTETDITHGVREKNIEMFDNGAKTGKSV